MQSQIKVEEIFHFSNGSTIFIVPKHWVGEANKITCEIIINGSSIGVKKLFINLICRPKRRLEFAAYSVMEKISISSSDECILNLI